jgi:hypothetical protein
LEDLPRSLVFFFGTYPIPRGPALKTIPHKVLLSGLLFVSLAQGAPPAGGPPLEQVIVEATRDTLAKLGKEVQQSEYRFYERYNELNENPDYAIKCSHETSTGTRFRRVACEPVFKSKAEQVEARDFIVAFGGGDHVSGMTGAPPGPPVAGGTFGPATLATAAGRPGFRKNMIEVTTRSPELTRMAQEHAALWKRFYTLYRKVNGAGPLPEEKSPAPAEPTSSGDSR